jgi:signal transduction histidine kinase
MPRWRSARAVRHPSMTDRADRRLRLFVTAAGPPLMLASAAYAAAGGATALTLVGIVVVSGSFLVAGLVAWARRPRNRTGRLLVTTGLCVLLTPLAGPPWPVLAPIGVIAGVVPSILLGYLILTFPSGELRSSASRVLIGLFGLMLLVTRFAGLVAFDPSGLGLTYVNPYLVIDDPAFAAGIVAVQAILEIVVVLGLLGLVVIRWLRASGPARRALSPVLVASVAVVLVHLPASFVTPSDVPADVKSILATARTFSHVLFPIGFLVGFLRIHMARSAIADLVVELGQTPTPARLRDALANALGDPTLAVAYWSPADGAYVDSGGELLALPAENQGRAITRLERDGVPIAAISHDPALLEDPGLVASVASAMRLAVENERLQAEVETQLQEVRASRVRIVEAGDTERKRVERDLHDGAQQRLVSLTLALRVAKMKLGDDADPAVRLSLDQASEDAREALVELRELARGIHPAILTEAGLGAAVETLADRSAVPTTVEGTSGDRLPPTIEGTAYFVVSEALANINKYSRATRARVRISRQNNRLIVEITDDGVGGADATRGSGLRGLIDRLSAIDGTLEIDSPTGGGTRLIAQIPMSTVAEVPG